MITIDVSYLVVGAVLAGLGGLGMVALTLLSWILKSINRQGRDLAGLTREIETWQKAAEYRISRLEALANGTPPPKRSTPTYEPLVFDQ